MRRRRTFVGIVIALGVALMCAALAMWSTSGGWQFAAYLAMGAGASVLKVRLPEAAATFSAGCIPVLVAIPTLTFTEIVSMAALLGILQSGWLGGSGRRMARVGFHIATMTLAAGAAWVLYGSAVAFLWMDHTLVGFIGAALAYFAVETTLSSAAIAQETDRHWKDVWHAWYLSSFPFYLSGAAIATLIVSWMHRSKWAPALLMLPLTYLVFEYFRRAATDPPKRRRAG